MSLTRQFPYVVRQHQLGGCVIPVARFATIGDACAFADARDKARCRTITAQYSVKERGRLVWWPDKELQHEVPR